MFLKNVLIVLAASLEHMLVLLGFYARIVTLKLTFLNMKTLTRFVSGEAIRPEQNGLPHYSLEEKDILVSKAAEVGTHVVATTYGLD